MIDALAQAIINRRLEARARAGGSFLAAQVSQEEAQPLGRCDLRHIAPLGEDWKAALRDVRAVIADALASPPTQERSTARSPK
jgi:zinc protease